MKKSHVLLAALLASLPLLSSCTASREDVATCEGDDGIVVTRPFKMHSEEKTRSFTFCEVNGKITEVYNENAEVELPSDAPEECEGDLYVREDKKEEKRGEKVEKIEIQHSFLCLEEGAVAMSYFTSTTY